MTQTAQYLTINSSNALSYHEANYLAEQEYEQGAGEEFDGFQYQGDHGEQCYVDFRDAHETFLMHPVSGYVQTQEEWIDESKDWECDIQAQLDSLVEVVRINGEWRDA